MSPISNSFTRTSLCSWTSNDSVVDVFPMQEAPFPTTVPWLFFGKEQLAMQSSDLIYSFILTSKESGHILAVFHCLPGAQQWTSPPLAPFGGIMPVAHCHERQLTFLLFCIRKWAIRMGCKTLTVKTAPACYHPLTHEICHRSYLAAGFSPNHTYSNHYIPITGQRFDQIIEPAERRRLAKGKNTGLHIYLKQGFCDETTGTMLRECDRAHGRQLRVAPGELNRIVSASPESYVTVTARNGEQTVAAALLVRVASHVLYHFLSGFLPEFRTISPSLMLFETAYQYCGNNGIQILDLGISLDHLGHEKTSLASFKRRIGGQGCPKIIYEAMI
ncbi:GNAT family N-acetyltransferase [Dyadobacter sp. BHUBP1]|uniref:GNAT family N-acetyltransferase n=1 Tax=Dyadobacter sp. BHUBP1 TaxID=3424178 RepID=UPI003D35862B